MTPEGPVTLPHGVPPRLRHSRCISRVNGPAHTCAPVHDYRSGRPLWATNGFAFVSQAHFRLAESPPPLTRCPSPHVTPCRRLRRAHVHDSIAFVSSSPLMPRHESPPPLLRCPSPHVIPCRRSPLCLEQANKALPRAHRPCRGVRRRTSFRADGLAVPECTAISSTCFLKLTANASPRGSSLPNAMLLPSNPRSSSWSVSNTAPLRQPNVRCPQHVASGLVSIRGSLNTFLDLAHG